jgi:hypothetical protein
MSNDSWSRIYSLLMLIVSIIIGRFSDFLSPGANGNQAPII